MNYKLWKNLRTSHNISQEELSTKLEVCKASISKYERYLIEPPTDKILKIAEIFDIDSSYWASDSTAIKKFNYDFENQNGNFFKLFNWERSIINVFSGKCDMCSESVNTSFIDSIELQQSLKKNVLKIFYIHSQ